MAVMASKSSSESSILRFKTNTIATRLAIAQRATHQPTVGRRFLSKVTVVTEFKMVRAHT